MSRRRLLLALVVLGFLAGGIWALARPAARPDRGAVDLAFETAAGGRRSLSELRGRPVILEFFAVWCPECRRDVSRLEDIRERFGTRIDVVAVAFEGRAPDVEAAVREAGGRYLVGIADPAARARFGIERFPTRFLIDAEGRVAGSDLDLPAILSKVDP